MKIIAFDLDGCLTNEPKIHYSEFSKCTPNINNINKLNTLYTNGFRIIIYTSRYIEDKDLTITWLSDNNIKYHEIIFNKLLADYYIDDKAININDTWSDIIMKGDN